MSFTVRGTGKVKIVRPFQETDKFYRCFMVTPKRLPDGTVINYEFAVKLVGKALEMANDLTNDTYLKVTNAKLSNKKDDRFVSSFKKTQIVIYEAEIISQDEFEETRRGFVNMETEEEIKETES